MRQRVEIARALAANSEIIYMDEPFGALDYFTRFKMRADLVRLWQQEQKTILFVTHDIDEAIQLAGRVVVLRRRPATIEADVPIDLPRPRDLSSPGYLEARDRILAAMGMSLRDAPGAWPTEIPPTCQRHPTKVAAGSKPQGLQSSPSMLCLFGSCQHIHR